MSSAETLGKNGARRAATAAPSQPRRRSPPSRARRRRPTPAALPSAFARGAQRGRRAEERRRAARRARAPAGRRADPSRRRAALRQPRLPRMDRLRRPRRGRGRGRARAARGRARAGALDRANGTGKTFTIATRAGDTLTCEGRLYTVPWQGESALMLVLVRTAADDRLQGLRARAARRRSRDARAASRSSTPRPTASIVVDRDGLVLALNRSAEALFGYEYHEIARRPFTELFAPESERAARDYLDGLTTNGVASVLNDGREVIGRVRQGGLIPLFMTMGRIGEGGRNSAPCCATSRSGSAPRRTCSTPSAPPSAPHRRNPISSPRSATRSARRSTPSSASPR